MKKSTFTADYRTLCKLLQVARERAGVTQVELAARLRETQSEISKFERGERRLDVVQLRWWCNALGLKFRDFVAEFEAACERQR